MTNSEQELWKEIPNTNGKYQISSLGRVRSVLRSKPHIIAIRLNAAGYPSVQLRIPSKGEPKSRYTTLLIGRTVASAFVPNPHNFHYISYKDGDKWNCAASNLEWVKMSLPMKKRYDSLKKRVNKYHVDGTFLASYLSAKDAAGANHYASAITTACLTGRLYLGYQWRYADEVPAGNIPPFRDTWHHSYCMLDKKTGKVIAHFNTSGDIVRYFKQKEGKDIVTGNISSCCKGKRSTAYGYKWTFSDDTDEAID